MVVFMVFLVPIALAMENDHHVPNYTGFDLKRKEFYVKKLSLSSLKALHSCNKELQAVHFLGKLLNAHNAQEQQIVARLMLDCVDEATLERIAVKGNISAGLVLLGLSKVDQQRARILFQPLQRSLATFFTDYENVLSLTDRSCEPVQHMVQKIRRVDVLLNNLNVKKKIQEYADLNEDANAYHVLALFKRLCGFAYAEKKDTQFVCNETLLIEACDYWEKALKCPELSADLKKQIQMDCANICHTLGAQLYYEVDPVKARYYLEKAFNLNPMTITKVELAYLLLINLAKSSTQQDKKWAKNVLDEIAQNPEDLEEFAIVFKNLGLIYYSGNTQWELAKDNDKAVYYWKILADAQFKEQAAISFHKEACNYYGMFLARNKYLSGQNQQEHTNNKTEDHLTKADLPEPYFKKIIALGDVHGYLGLGLCNFWKGIYDQADVCFSKIITGLSPQPLEISEAHEADLDRINQAIAFWCKGSIIFTKKIESSDHKLGITLMEMAFQKLPILTSSELFLRHLPTDILQELSMAADHVVSGQSNSNLDITLIYLVGRLYGVLPNCQMHGMKYVSYAAERDHNWALLYLGCCQNFDKEDANIKANYLVKIKKNSENDLCYIQAQYYLQKFAQWGILSALLGLAQTKLTEGKLHEWLSELKVDEFGYDFLFNNITENLHPKELVSDEVYKTLMNDESICGRMIKSMILMSDPNIKDVKVGLTVGEKILPDLRKAHKRGYEVWKKFLEGLPLLETFVRTAKDDQITLEEFKKIYLVAKSGNNAARISVAAIILMDKVAAHDVRACIKEIGKKDLVKDYARKILNDALSLDKVSSFSLFEKMITGLLLNSFVDYLFKHGDKKEAERYAAIASKLGYKPAKRMQNSIQDTKKSDAPKLIRISASNRQGINFSAKRRACFF